MRREEGLLRDAARSAGLITFVTGKPCVRGHTSERYVRNSECVACCVIRAGLNADRIAETMRRWKQAHPKAFRQYAATYYERHKERCTIANLKWQKNNPDKVKASLERNRDSIKTTQKKYRTANPHIATGCAMRRRARMLHAMPPWSKQDIILKIYEEAAKLGMQVDHVVPLLGNNVCGLHVENNLQLLSAAQNRAKGNKWDAAES